MKITVEDSSMVNWDRVAEMVHEEIKAKVIEVLGEMQRVLTEIKPGQRRTIPIRVGSVTVSKPR